MAGLAPEGRRKTESNSETHLSAKPACPQAPPRLPQAHAYRGRNQGSCAPAREGAQAPFGVSIWRPRAVELQVVGGAEADFRVGPLTLITLKKRAEFLRVRGGARWASPSFVLEAKPRVECDKPSSPPRFGFTVTKRLGNAVIRNRIRRRLREATRVVAPDLAQAGFDYVLIARTRACDQPFRELTVELEQALGRVHRSQASKPRAREP